MKLDFSHGIVFLSRRYNELMKAMMTNTSGARRADGRLSIRHCDVCAAGIVGDAF